MLRWLGRLFRRLLVFLFALVGGAVVSLAAIAGLVYLWISTVSDGRLPERMVLSLTPDAAASVEEAGEFYRLLPIKRLSTEDIVDALERAERDDRVRGLFLDASAVGS